MDVLRTPEHRFADLPGFVFTPRYREGLPGFNGLRMHFVDEGPSAAAATFLCLHGQPTWGYLYRRMVPTFLSTGVRVVVPDLFGFGRSDKPTDEATYTFDFHRNSLLALIEALDLRHITLVCQDWGGLLGLTLPMQLPDRFDRLLIMNTALATGDQPLSAGFTEWRAWANAHPDMAVGRLLKRGCPHLSDREAAAYDAPFPDVTYKAGVRRFPNLVPELPDQPGAELSRQARRFWRENWSGTSLMVIGAADPVLGEPVMRQLHGLIRGCPPPLILPDVGHFVPEWGEQVAKAFG